MKKLVLYLKDKNKGIYDYICISGITVFVLQFLWLTYENLCNIKYYLGYDNSMDLLYAIVSSKTNELFVSDFDCTTSQFYTPLESTIYKVSNNIFFAYGLGNIIHMMVVLYFTYRIIDELLEGESKLKVLLAMTIAGNLLICPYVNESNVWELSYAHMTSFSVACYIGFLMIESFVLWVFIQFERNERLCLKDRCIVVLGSIAVTVRMMSNFEILIITVFIPIIICTFTKVIIKNDVSLFKTKQACWTYIISLIAIVSFIGNIMFAQKSISDNMNWISVFDFPSNLLGVLAGYLNLVSALPFNNETPFLSIDSVGLLSGLFIAGSIIIAFVMVLKTLVKGTDNGETVRILPLVSIVVISTVFYSLVDSDYAGTGFACRYLITPYYALVIILIVFLNSLSDSTIFKVLWLSFLIILITYIDISSDAIRVKHRTTTDRMEQIDFLISECGNDSKLVYFIGSVNNDVRNMRVWNPGIIFKDIWTDGELWHWGDYLYSDEAADDQGPYLIFCNKENKDLIPPYVSSRIKFLGDWNEYDIFYGENTVYDFETRYDSSVSYDFPHSPEITCNHLEINDKGEYISDGSGDYIMYGPNR